MIIDYILIYSINVKLITGLIYFSHANIFTNIFRGCLLLYYFHFDFQNVTLDIYIICVPTRNHNNEFIL